MFFMYNFAHFILYLDLLFIIKYPFKNQKSRNWSYVFTTLIGVVIVMTTMSFVLTHKKIYLIVVLIIIMTFIITITILMCTILFKLSSQGTSPDIRNKILWRYTLVFFVYLLHFMAYVFTTYWRFLFTYEE